MPLYEARLGDDRAAAAMFAEFAVWGDPGDLAERLRDRVDVHGMPHCELRRWDVIRGRRRGPQRDLADLATDPGLPVTPPPAAKPPFQAYWETATVTRPSLTFADAPPNHDHVVRIAQPGKKTPAKASTGRKQPSRLKAARPPIPVIYAQP